MKLKHDDDRKARIKELTSRTEGAGKGDKPRPITKKYWDNYDEIDWKKKQYRIDIVEMAIQLKATFTNHTKNMNKKPQGLYAAIHAKRNRIAAGSGEKMRKPGSKGAPTAQAFKQSAKTAKKK